MLFMGDVLAEDWEAKAREFEEMLRSVGALIVTGAIVAIAMIGVGAIVWSHVKVE
jgi:hypothetical protein